MILFYVSKVEDADFAVIYYLFISIRYTPKSDMVHSCFQYKKLFFRGIFCQRLSLYPVCQDLVQPLVIDPGQGGRAGLHHGDGLGVGPRLGEDGVVDLPVEGVVT